MNLRHCPKMIMTNCYRKVIHETEDVKLGLLAWFGSFDHDTVSELDGKWGRLLPRLRVLIILFESFDGKWGVVFPGLRVLIAQFDIFEGNSVSKLMQMGGVLRGVLD